MFWHAQGWAVLARLMLVSIPAGSCESDTPIPSANEPPSTCHARDINYVTDTLPDQCYRARWQQADSIVPRDGDQTAEYIGHDLSFLDTRPADREENDDQTATPSVETINTVDDHTEATTFMSFEDWKDLKAREAERDAQDTNPDSEKAWPPPQGHDSREESDIALKVEAVSEELSSIAAPPRQSLAGAGENEQASEPVLYDDGKAQYYRSKDAGKTCKERFSYSSFDAGATVLKTNTGAKNAKAILVENKDSYMLLECAAVNKFAIVELTDDILIDTVVLANFEFFSSMIRHFKVSVSDRYPVKVEKWKDLGIFEAKNSRDIQPFLVENPLIWAKYVRIEFLTHYGNEYYCPVSLLRVHGTRMLDSWKDTEAPPDEDDAEDVHVDAVLDLTQDVDIDQAQRVPPPDNNEAAEVTHQERSIWSDVGNSVPSSPLQASRIQENPLDFTCPVNTAVLEEAASKPRSTVDTLPHKTGSQKADIYPAAHPDDLPHSQRSKEHWTGPLDRVDDPSDLVAGKTSTGSPSTTPVTVATSRPTSVPHISSQNASRIASGSPKRPSPVAQAPTRSKNGTSTSVPPASPTVQESFHKAVSKRLQLLESNVTLSLEYLEEQSRFLQQSQRASERRQLAKVDLLLDSLNHTVLSELRHVRQQYDQIWQSTIMALENQRDQSQRELVALGSRLNVLADEVVFQKRMAILQAILLLSCLVMVIFSRTVVSVSPNQMDVPFSSSRQYQYRLPRALHSSGLGRAHNGHLSTSIVEYDHEGDAQQQGQVYGTDPFIRVHQHSHEGSLANARRTSGPRPERARLATSPISPSEDDPWVTRQSKDVSISPSTSATPPTTNERHISRSFNPHSSEQVLTPSSSDAQDTQSDGIGSDPSSEDGSRTPPSPLGRLANTHDLGAGFRKPLPALPEHLPS